MRVGAREPGADEGARSFLQSDFWADFKSGYGWSPIRLQLLRGEGAEENGQPESIPILLLLRPLGMGLSFAYMPLGPGFDPGPGKRGPFLAELSERLRPYLPSGCLFIRYDPPWVSLEDEGPADRASGLQTRPVVGPPLVRSAVDVQPPDSVFLDLRLSERELLARMKPKWRYNIRLAEKKGVVVASAGAESVEAFYSLNRVTAARDRIALRPIGYYRRLLSLAAERRIGSPAGAPDVRLWFASHDGRILASIITLFRGDEAVYLFGASSDEERNLMPTYALQWTAIQAAKAAGCLRYDLYGIPPQDEPGQAMAGLYRFKTGFGGSIARYPGSWDYPLRRFGYRAFSAGERARAWWYKDFKKRLKKGRSS